MRRIPLNRLKTNFILNSSKNTFLFSPKSAEKPSIELSLSTVSHDHSEGSKVFYESNDDFQGLSMQQLQKKQCPCDRDTQIDDMLFSDESDSEFAKMDTGATTEDNFLASLSNSKKEQAELDEFLLDADSLRSCFSKQITLNDEISDLCRQNSAK